MATDFFFLLNISYSDGTIILFQKVKDQIEAIIEQLGEDQEKSSIKSKKSSSSSSSSEHENDEADTGNGLRYSIYIRTVSSLAHFVYFVDSVKTCLWAVSAEQHAQST